MLPSLDPVTPVKAATGKMDGENPLTPVVVTRTNVYQVPPKTKTTSQKLLPTAKAAAKATAKAEQPGDQGPPTCKRGGCDHPTWNGKAGFYCSKACKDKGSTTTTCEASGCVNARYEGSPYCSLDCMEKAKAKKAEPGAGVPNIGEPTKGPMIGVIQSNVPGQGVGATPVQPVDEPEKACDMPPDPCELRQHPQLGVVSYQMMQVNYDYQVQAGAQEPYDPDPLLIHWNSLKVYGQRQIRLSRNVSKMDL